MDHYLNAWRNYANFRGRARRTEFWMFTLINILCVGLLLFLDRAIAALLGMPSQLLFTMLYVLAVLLPSIALQVRRLHDSGHSGWFYLLGLIPYVGGILLLIFNLLGSDEGTNRYGPNPKSP